MSSEIDPQEFGRMSANVQALLDNQATIKADLAAHQNDIRVQLHDSNKRIFDKLDAVIGTVSEIQVSIATMKPVCERHTEEIKHLKDRPGRIVEIGAALVASVAAILAWIGLGGR